MAKRRAGALTKEEGAMRRNKALRLYLYHDLTQAEVAETVGVSKTTINKWAQEDKWAEQKEVSNMTPDRLQAETLKEINKILDGGEPDYAKIKAIRMLYNVYADLAKMKGDMAQFMEGFRRVSDWFESQNRIEDAKTANRLHDEFVKGNI